MTSPSRAKEGAQQERVPTSDPDAEGALPGAALATQYINALVGAGKGDLDSSAIFGLQQALSSVGQQD